MNNIIININIKLDRHEISLYYSKDKCKKNKNYYLCVKK